MATTAIITRTPMFTALTFIIGRTFTTAIIAHILTTLTPIIDRTGTGADTDAEGGLR